MIINKRSLISGAISISCAFALLLRLEFLQQSFEPLWHIPMSSFIVIVFLVSTAALGKFNARKHVAQQCIANIGLASALSWFPLSLIFSGNVRNIFSASSLVSYDLWFLFSALPVVATLVLITWNVITAKV